MDGAEFLWVSLKKTAHQREVLVDPDEDAATKQATVIATAHDDEGLLVLSANGIKKLRAVVATALPVRPNEGDRAWVLIVVGQAHAVG
jgi:hypothetical protein